MKNYGLQLVSPISFLRARIPDDEYSYILSFRRQVYISPPIDEYQLHAGLVIPFENNWHCILLSTDKMECFLRKQTKHIATNFPNPQIANRPQSMSKTSYLMGSTPVETLPLSNMPGQKDRLLVQMTLNHSHFDNSSSKS